MSGKIDEKHLSTKSYSTKLQGCGRNIDKDGPFSIVDNKWKIVRNENYMEKISRAINDKITIDIENEKKKKKTYTKI